MTVRIHLCFFLQVTYWPYSSGSGNLTKNTVLLKEMGTNGLIVQLVQLQFDSTVIWCKPQLYNSLGKRQVNE